MVTKIIAILLLFITILLIAVTGWSFFMVNKIGLLKTFLKNKWALGLLSAAFVVMFLVSGTGVLLGVAWALPALRYTLGGWILYIWLYNVKAIFDLIAVLKWEKATTISQFMGRSELFDKVLEKSIELSRQGTHAAPEADDDAHAVSDAAWEELLGDEQFYREVMPAAIRQRIRRKVIGLLVLTVIFGGMLLLLG